MITKSTISIHKLDGKIDTIYCHYDGYYEHNGVILYNFYNTPEKVKELIAHGDLSCLGTEIGKKHDFDKRGYYACTFYRRDRGEENYLRIYDSYEDIDSEEYNYIFVEETQEWLVSRWNYNQYKKLEDVFRIISLKEWMIVVSNEEQYQKMINFYKKFGSSDMKILKFEDVSYEI